MNNEQWEYKIDGKIGGITKIVIGFVLSVIFVMLTIDQLQPQPNKSIHVAFFFGSIAVIALSLLIFSLMRYFCFKVYIGKNGFYFQSNPFNGRYYLYSDMKHCKEELKIYRHRQSSNSHYYYFIFTTKSGKTVKFQFEKNIYEREMNALKKHIKAQSIQDFALIQDDKKDDNVIVLKKPFKKVWIVFIIVLVAVISSIGIYFARTEQYKDWTTASGVVLKIEQYSVSRRRGISNSHRIYYAYSINNQTYTGNNVYSGKETDFSEGDMAKIWYNPDNPSQSSFHKAGPGLDPFVPFFIGIPLALIIFGITKRRKITKKID